MLGDKAITSCREIQLDTSDLIGINTIKTKELGMEQGGAEHPGNDLDKADRVIVAGLY